MQPVSSEKTLLFAGNLLTAPKSNHMLGTPISEAYSGEPSVGEGLEDDKVPLSERLSAMDHQN